MATGDKTGTPEDEGTLQRFVDFLSIRTVSGEGANGAYDAAADWLQARALEIGLETTVVSFVPNKPVVIMKWPGQDPSLPSVLLNSHYDVVPAIAEMWKTEPFTPVISPEGNIYARGTQDMKCVCMQYFEAVRRFKLRYPELTYLVEKAQASPFLRTIYLSYMPDEEVGGFDGAGYFVRSDLFKSMNVGVALDEGLASPTEAFTVFYGERAPWFFTVRATGPTGHGSRFIENPATHKLVTAINRALAFRAEQEAKLHPGCTHGVAKKLGDVVSLNLTALKAGLPGPAHFGGYALNVVPPEAEAGFDIRIPPSVPLDDMEKILQSWVADQEGVTVKFHQKVAQHHVTSTDREKNRWWQVFEDTFHKNGWPIEPEVFPAATDSRYIRALNIPCFGFSPMNRTPILLHDHNEFIHRDIYLRGIHVYEQLVTSLANADASVHAER